jgi:hypothetical protein
MGVGPDRDRLRDGQQWLGSLGWRGWHERLGERGDRALVPRRGGCPRAPAVGQEHGPERRVRNRQFRARLESGRGGRECEGGSDDERRDCSQTWVRSAHTQGSSSGGSTSTRRCWARSRCVCGQVWISEVADHRHPHCSARTLGAARDGCSYAPNFRATVNCFRPMPVGGIRAASYSVDTHRPTGRPPARAKRRIRVNAVKRASNDRPRHASRSDVRPYSGRWNPLARSAQSSRSRS